MDSIPTESEAFWNRVRLRQTLRDVALLFAIVGGIAALAALVSLLRAQSVQTWPTVQGIVTYSGLESRPIAGRIVRFEPVAVVIYQYELDGQTYASETITEGVPPVPGKTAEAERLLAAYPVDAIVTVYFSPRDPVRAVLEPQGQQVTTFQLLLLFGLAGVFVLLAALLRPGRAKPG